MDDKEARLQRIIGWAVDHCLADVNLDASLIVAGDPEILGTASPLSASSLKGEPWAIVDLPGGSVLLLSGDVGQDGPWLFATSTSDGPLDAVTLQPSIWTDGVKNTIDGALTLTSGRLVVGEPGTVAAWGPAVAPDDGLPVQAKTGWDKPEPMYIGLVVVAQVAPGVSRPLEVAESADGSFHSISIKFPRPAWTPEGLRP